MASGFAVPGCIHDARHLMYDVSVVYMYVSMYIYIYLIYTTDIVEERDFSKRNTNNDTRR